MTDWQSILREQARGRIDPWLVLEGRAMVEGAIAGWWEVAGVAIAVDEPWEVPLWSGMEVARLPRAELAGWGEPAAHGGVLGLAKLPTETGEVAAFMRSLEPDAVLVVCPRLSTPEVAGLAIRLAAAHGAAGVLFGAEGVSPFHPEALRTAGAAVFGLPLRIADGGLLLRSLKAAGVVLCGWERGDDAGTNSVPVAGRRALVMGDPELGLGPFWRAACDRHGQGTWAQMLEEMNG
jgi:tRNA G18 (ribose-2'-O)-methylase SpoU